MQQMVQLFEVIGCFEGTHSHLLLDNSDHVRRIFDLAFSSICFEIFKLSLPEEDNMQTAALKADILTILNFMTLGLGFFTRESGLQSQGVIHSNIAIA